MSHLHSVSQTSSHFFLPAASIHWPHSVCSSQGVQETSTYKTKSLWSPKTILKLSKKLLFCNKINNHSIVKGVSLFIREATFNKWEAKGKKYNISCGRWAEPNIVWQYFKCDRSWTERPSAKHYCYRNATLVLLRETTCKCLFFMVDYLFSGPNNIFWLRGFLH